MVYIIIIAGVFFVDLLIKNYIDKTRKLHKKDKILKDKIIIQKFYNKGAILNSFEDNRAAVIIMSAAATAILGVLLIVFNRRQNPVAAKVGLAFAIGGGLNNLYDRIVRKHVIDYFSFNVKCDKLKKIVFNISDIAIIVGTFVAAMKSNPRN